jgi:DNA-binding transcriptional ArsR family regulator
MRHRPDAVFRSLADPTRRALLERLMQKGEHTVGALTDYAGISQPAVSKHLAVLKAAGLVEDRRDGREAHYRVRPAGFAPLFDWLRFYSAFWSDRFTRLEDLLKRMDQ